MTFDNELHTLAAQPKSTLKISSGVRPVDVDPSVYAYLPPDLIGGSLPHVSGSEDEAVWNAASQACATDRVHYTYTVSDDRIWYLATPSSSLASHPESWCPMAAALPGNSEYWDQETVYIYDQEGTAAGLRWDNETHRMQVFVGPSRTILPRLQTLDANFVTINAERAKPVAWRNRALYEEKLSRATVRGLFWTGCAVAIVSLAILLIGHSIGMMLTPGLMMAQSETRQATDRLMTEASKAVRNEADAHMFRLQSLLLTLDNVNGTLLRYEVQKGRVEWEALIPPAVGGDNLRALRATPVGTAPDGRLKIKGNS